MIESVKKMIILIALVQWVISCGPTCLEITSGMSGAEILKNDAIRVNELVHLRKLTMDLVKSDETSTVSINDLNVSFTAYEMAIELQLRIMAHSSENDGATRSHEQMVNETRCFLDNVIENGKARIKGKHAQKIRDTNKKHKRLFPDAEELNDKELKAVYENGVKIPQ